MEKTQWQPTPHSLLPVRQLQAVLRSPRHTNLLSNTVRSHFFFFFSEKRKGEKGEGMQAGDYEVWQ